MINLKKILSYIFYSKKKLAKPEHKKILIYDKGGSSVILHTLPKNSAEVLCINGEEINLYILFNVIFSKIFLIFQPKKIWKTYIETYINQIDPKIIITFVDNNSFFYTLKNKFPKIKFIAIQNGYRFFKDDIFGVLKHHTNKNNSLKCDYIFCFNKYVAKLYEKHISCKTIKIGSFRNNLTKIKKNRRKSLLFISSYGLNSSSIEKKIIPIISNYCKKHNIKLLILGRGSNINEVKFYNSLNQNKDFQYITNVWDGTNLHKSYTLLDQANTVISLNATLGYESLGRGVKTIFINLNDRKLNCQSYLTFAWPLKSKNNGPFWLGVFNKKKIIEVLNSVYKMRQEEWRKKIAPKVKDLMNYNYGNKIFLNKINNLINK